MGTPKITADDGVLSVSAPRLSLKQEDDRARDEIDRSC